MCSFKPRYSKVRSGVDHLSEFAEKQFNMFPGCCATGGSPPGSPAPSRSRAPPDGAAPTHSYRLSPCSAVPGSPFFAPRAMVGPVGPENVPVRRSPRALPFRPGRWSDRRADVARMVRAISLPGVFRAIRHPAPAGGPVLAHPRGHRRRLPGSLNEALKAQGGRPSGSGLRTSGTTFCCSASEEGAIPSYNDGPAFLFEVKPQLMPSGIENDTCSRCGYGAACR